MSVCVCLCVCARVYACACVCMCVRIHANMREGFCLTCDIMLVPANKAYLAPDHPSKLTLDILLSYLSQSVN